MSTSIKNFFLIVLLLIVGAAYALQINTAKGIFLYTDYGKFYQSLRFVLQGESAYTPIHFTIKPKPHEKKPVEKKLLGPNLNPPFFVLLALPLGLVGYATSLWCWLMLSVLCGIASIYLLIKALPIERPPLFLVLNFSLALFAYFPTFTNLALGQVGLFLLPFIVGAWLAARRKQLIVLGIILGIATSLKPFLGLFGLYFLVRREWRALIYFCLAFLLINLLTLWLLGKINYLDYFHNFHFIAWYSSSWNASYLGFFSRLFGDNELNIPLIPIKGLTSILYPLCVLFTVLGLIKFLTPTSRISDTTKTDLDFSITLVAIFLISPLGWIYYFPFLIIAFLTLYRLAQQGHYPIGLRLITSLAIILSALPFYLRPPVQISNYIIVLNWAGCYFYALLILFFTLFLLRYHLLRQIPVAVDHCPPYLAMLLYVVAFLPSLLGIMGTSRGLLLYSTDYTPKYDKVYFGTNETPAIIMHFKKTPCLHGITLRDGSRFSSS